MANIITQWLNSNNFAELRDKVNAIVTVLSSGTIGQYLRKSGDSDGEFEWQDFPRIPNLVSSVYESSGRTVTTTPTTLYSFTTPNDGITRKYYINYTAVIDANQLLIDFFYKTSIFLASISTHEWRMYIPNGDQVTYIHNIILEIEPNTLFELKDYKETGTDGGIIRDILNIHSIN